MKRFIKYLASLIIILMLITSCSSPKKASQAYDSTRNSVSDMAAPEMAAKKDAASGSAPAPASQNAGGNIQGDNRKIIRNATIEIQTLDFDKSSDELLNKIKLFGGYVENSNVKGKKVDNGVNNDAFIENRYAYISARIPVKNFDQFIKDLGDVGNIINESINTNDITFQYFDTEARLKSLTIQQERLLELLKKSGELKDILEIERELQRIRYEIEGLTGTLKKWNDLIDYSTLNINLYEVQKYKKSTPLSIKDKAYYAFMSSIENIIYLLKSTLLFIISLIPYLVVLLPCIFILKYLNKNKKFNLKNLFKINKKDN